MSVVDKIRASNGVLIYLQKFEVGEPKKKTYRCWDNYMNKIIVRYLKEFNIPYVKDNSPRYKGLFRPHIDNGATAQENFKQFSQWVRDNFQRKPKLMKVIIAGGRDFRDYTTLAFKCDKILSSIEVAEIVSGKQVSIDKDTGEKWGADYFGEEYAKNRKYKVAEFPADWDKHPKAAGPIRNRQMAKYADALIAFWDGKSRGTKNMIEEARKEGLKIRIVKY